MANTLEQQNALEDLIRKRQFFEKNNPREPYKTRKTDVNYFDIHGSTLLHYAAANGDLAKVQACLDNGADVNLPAKTKETAIEIALQNGHLQIAQLLFARKDANCVNVHPKSFGNEECREWFHKQIKLALSLSYPSPKRSIEKLYAETKFFRTSKVHNILLPLTRAVEVGNIDFLEAVLTNYPDEFVKALEGDDVTPPLLVTAAQNRQMEVVKFLVENGADINSKKTYADSALKFAVMNNDDELIDYLLSQGADINKQDKNKVTPIMVAVSMQNQPLIDKLILKGADLTKKTISKNNLLHLAAQTSSPEILEHLLTKAQLKPLVLEKNIYGQKPSDIALLKLEEKSPSFIYQNRVLAKMRYYLVSHYRNTEFFEEDGHCIGLSFLKSFYSAKKMSPYFFDTLALMADWDGKESSLRKPLVDIPHAKAYKEFGYNSLGDIFEQWINDTIWFQHTKLDKVDEIWPDQMTQQYDIVKDKENIQRSNDYSYCRIFTDDFNLFDEKGEVNPYISSRQQLEEIFSYLMRLPANIHIKIGGGKHATSGYINSKNQFDYYDPNAFLKIEDTNDVNEIVDRVLDYKYILLNKDIDCRINTFCFLQDKQAIDLETFQIFSEIELPENPIKAKEFQSASPNHFTHLHIAIMTRSHSVIKRLLADGYCDINSRDAMGRTPLRLIIESDNVDALTLIMELPELDLSDIGSLATEAYVRGRDNVLQMIVNHPRTKNLDWLLHLAITKGDLDLVKRLIRNNKININEFHKNYLPLNTAIIYADIDMVDLFLKHHADITKVDKEFNTAISLSIMRYHESYPAIIGHMQDINHLDETGNAPIHHAVCYTQFAILEDLLKRGANINLANSEGRNVFNIIEDMPHLNENERLKFKKLCFSFMSFDLTNAGACTALFNTLIEKMKENDEIFKIFLDKCDKNLINERSSDGYTLLHYAAMNLQTTKLEMLLKAGCDIDAVTPKSGNTVLLGIMKAPPSPEKYNVIEILLKYHPRTDLAGKSGKTAIDLVKESDDTILKQIFIDHDLISANQLKSRF